MGNCLKINNADDAFLIADNDNFRNSVEQPNIAYTFQDVRQVGLVSSDNNTVKISKRLGFIRYLPVGKYEGTAKFRECVICMIDFCLGESVRCLPCMHTYHVHCIDNWLMRRLTCPFCMEPVDAALFNIYRMT